MAATLIPLIYIDSPLKKNAFSNEIKIDGDQFQIQFVFSQHLLPFFANTPSKTDTERFVERGGCLLSKKSTHISLTKPNLIIHSKFNIFSSIRYFFLALKRVCVHFSIYFRLIVFSTTSLYLSLYP